MVGIARRTSASVFPQDRERPRLGVRLQGVVSRFTSTKSASPAWNAPATARETSTWWTTRYRC